jgi:hypothetical protein
VQLESNRLVSLMRYPVLTLYVAVRATETIRLRDCFLNLTVYFMIQNNRMIECNVSLQFISLGNQIFRSSVWIHKVVTEIYFMKKVFG